MKYLKLPTIKASENKNEWDNINLRQPSLIYVKNLYDFKDYCRQKGLSTSTESIPDDPEYREFITVSSNGSYYDIFVILEDTDNDTLLKIERKIFNSWARSNSPYLKNPNEYEKIKRIIKIEDELLDADRNIENNKLKYVNSIERKNNLSTQLRNELSNDRRMKRLGIKNGVYYFEFKNVIAEDTCVEGEDINLGDLKFEVNFNRNDVKLIEGTEMRTAFSNIDQFHPHQMSNNTLCFGSQSSDMVAAITNLELGVINAMLHKFAHSYTSNDEAGRYWRAWTEEGMQNVVYSERYGHDIDEEEAVYTVDGDWIYRDDAISIDGDWFDDNDDNIRWSETDDRYYHSDDCTYSELMEDYIGDSNLITLQNNRGVVNSDYGNMTEYDGDFYHDDDIVEDINGDSIPVSMTVYNDITDEFILKDDAVEGADGNWYTEDTLPTFNEEGEVVEETVEAIQTPTTEEPRTEPIV